MRLPAIFLIACRLFAGPVEAELERLARAHREKPRPATRAALEKFAAAHPKDINGALALLAAGAHGDAPALIARARPRLGPVADLAAWLE